MKAIAAAEYVAIGAVECCSGIMGTTVIKAIAAAILQWRACTAVE